MIVFILFVLSIVFLCTRELEKAIFLFIVFATKGLCLIPENTTGLKMTHCAFLFILVCFVIYGKTIIFYLKRYGFLWPLIFFLIFILASISFSIFYYNFPPVACITTGMRYFVFLSLGVFFILDTRKLHRLFILLFYITFYTSILYILQCLTGVTLLAYNLETSGNTIENGLFRFYNVPPFSDFYMYIAIFDRDRLPKPYRLGSTILFPLLVFLSSARVAIIVMVFTIILIAAFVGKAKQYFKFMLPLLVGFFLVQDMVIVRMEKGGSTTKDLELLAKGDLKKAHYQSKNGYTMLYRFAWINERLQYLKRRPLIESVFGLGMITDESPEVNKKYHFRYGLINPVTNHVAQIRTPDIAWGNFLTVYGLGGTLLFAIFYIRMIRRYSKHRKDSRLSMILYGYFLMWLLGGMAGATMSEPYNLTAPFFLTVYMLRELEQNTNLRLRDE